MQTTVEVVADEVATEAEGIAILLRRARRSG